MGIYRISTGKLIKDDKYNEWPHYFESKNLIPNYTKFAFENKNFIDLETCEIEFQGLYKDKNIMQNAARLPGLGTCSDHLILSPYFTDFVHCKLLNFINKKKIF